MGSAGRKLDNKTYMVENEDKASTIACGELSQWMIDNGISKESAEEIIRYMDVDPATDGYILFVKYKLSFCRNEF